MRYDKIRTAEEAIIYITDCNLATVEHMASLKAVSKHEFSRQIEIAQRACDFMKWKNIDNTTFRSRANEIIGKQSVKEWAQKITDSNR